jgi:hypothetical protein
MVIRQHLKSSKLLWNMSNCARLFFFHNPHLWKIYPYVYNNHLYDDSLMHLTNSFAFFCNCRWTVTYRIDTKIPLATVFFWSGFEYIHLSSCIPYFRVCIRAQVYFCCSNCLLCFVPRYGCYFFLLLDSIMVVFFWLVQWGHWLIELSKVFGVLAVCFQVTQKGRSRPCPISPTMISG